MNITVTNKKPDSGSNMSYIIPVNAAHKNFEAAVRDYHLEGRNLLRKKLNGRNGNYATSFKGNTSDNVIICINTDGYRNMADWSRRCNEALAANRELISESVCIDLRFTEAADFGDRHLGGLARSIFFLGGLKSRFKTSDANKSITFRECTVLERDNAGIASKSVLERAAKEVETIQSCRDLVDAPANHKTVASMSEWMRNSARKYGYRCEILDKEELQEMGFHGLLAVNKGSSEPARCIIAKYSGKHSENNPSIALVGKGITFDTGGVSLKPSRNMHYMKSDMGGAAAVMGTIEMAAKLELPVNLYVVVPATDNSIGSDAIKPGDIIGSYSGSSIEIIDTDAEGRLVLADGLSYSIRNFKPDYVIDLATLTGSVVRALGNYAAGLMTTNDELAATLKEAGDEIGERLWRLPLWEDYAQHMRSDMADIRNLSDKPMAGAITAGKFLEHFTDEHQAWAHIDIAGTAFHQTPYAKGYSATGFGILLLVQWLERLVV